MVKFIKDIVQLINANKLAPRFYNTDPFYYANLRFKYCFVQMFKKHLGNKNIEKILDYGCGEKPFKDILSPYCKQYIGVDIVENPKADIIIKNNDNIPIENGTVDAVLSTQVLEHVENLDQYLNECQRIMKKDGLLFLSTHGTWHYHPDPYDVQRWTSYGLKSLIIKYRFEILDFIPVLGQLALTSQLRMTYYYYNCTCKLGKIGRKMIIPISMIYQLKMMIEDYLTPQTSKNEDSAFYIVVAKK